MLVLASCAGSPKTKVSKPQLAQNAVPKPAASIPVAAPKKDTLPDGEWIMSKYIEAIGGETAHKKITSRITTCDMEIDNIGIGATFTISQKAPNLFLTKVKSEAMGDMSDGYNGSVAWEKSALNGISFLNGAEKLESIRDGDIHADIHWKKYFESAETLGKESLDDSDVFKVSLKSLSGSEEIYFIDSDSYLLRRKETILLSEGKSEKIAFEFSDYREVDGIVMPFSAMNETAELTFNMKCNEVVHNQEIADSFFELPSDVQAALKQKETKML